MSLSVTNKNSKPSCIDRIKTGADLLKLTDREWNEFYNWVFEGGDDLDDSTEPTGFRNTLLTAKHVRSWYYGWNTCR